MGRAAHGLGATMLADPKLRITEQFGVRNQNINNFNPFARPGLPIPTSLLIDEKGTVVWKDQSDNYTRRSDPEIVRAALNEHFVAGEA